LSSGALPPPRRGKALRFASRASTDSVQFLDSVRSVTGTGPHPHRPSGPGAFARTPISLSKSR
jgi:hypothetical protein